ncbi:exodeoxyribonuclease III [Egicoccus halophilus]|uniref:Exodeoxyribonuclease III n=1 Tax=Egicoccus halophilus TaxID=1670830 RepID=A0A8J3ETD9_9ACTN|nr:exodeoxyribonuclease III [Egicoccus halophilus]GGI03735.1 exodeoxyribonuclease III [Egicoccus halophilus]
MRLVTWNVNSLKARLPRVLELLDEHDPDVVCLQETKCAAEAFPHREFGMAGYTAVDHSAGRWNGVALLVRQDLEIDEVVHGLPGEPDEAEARWVEARVGGVSVVSTYVVNGRSPDHPMFAAKLHFFEAMRDRTRTLVAAGPTVVAGDLNVTRDDRDLWDPGAWAGSTHVTPEERAHLEAILALGLVDAWRQVAPDEVGYTWWDYRMGAFHRGMGMRLDYALVSEHLGVRTVRVDRSYRKNNRAGDKPSDHAPVLVELDRFEG